MSNQKFCVFCGQKPTAKNKEHVLPQWLLKMTGDPRRVVKFGINFETREAIEFSWSSFVVPACTDCNESFSKLETQVQPILEGLVSRESISAQNYLILLDWLDKVRVGVWLAYYLIQKNPIHIQPRFHIEARMGAKDRLVALYPIETDQLGLNAFGVESLMFHSTPSCFGLRINSLLMLNMSADFLFAARCGFPSPRVRQLILDDEAAGMLRLTDFTCTRRVRHPIMRERLHKPSVLLYQPIMQKSIAGKPEAEFYGDYSVFDSFLAEHTLPPYPSGKGVLFRQYGDRVEVMRDMSKDIEFDSIAGYECKPMYSLIAQVYDFQNYIHGLFEPIAEDRQRKANFVKFAKTLAKHNTRMSNYLKRQLAEPA